MVRRLAFICPVLLLVGSTLHDGTVQSIERPTRRAQDPTGIELARLQERLEILRAFNTLTPEQQAAVWEKRVLWCLDHLPLTRRERNAVNEGLRLLRPGVYEKTIEGETLRRSDAPAWSRIHRTLGTERMLRIFYELPVAEISEMTVIVRMTPTEAQVTLDWLSRASAACKPRGDATDEQPDDRSGDQDFYGVCQCADSYDCQLIGWDWECCFLLSLPDPPCPFCIVGWNGCGNGGVFMCHSVCRYVPI